MYVLKTVGLFFLTAIAEIVGCYLPYLWLRQGKTPWLLLPGAVSLGLFAWLLSLHPTAAGRTYAAYGGVYVAVAVFWLWWIDGVRPDRWDLIGAGVTLLGMSIIAFGPAYSLISLNPPEVEFDGVVIRARHDAIVSDVLFQRCNAEA